MLVRAGFLQGLVARLDLSGDDREMVTRAARSLVHAAKHACYAEGWNAAIVAAVKIADRNDKNAFGIAREIESLTSNSPR